MSTMTTRPVVGTFQGRRGRRSLHSIVLHCRFDRGRDHPDDVRIWLLSQLAGIYGLHVRP